MTDWVTTKYWHLQHDFGIPVFFEFPSALWVLKSTFQWLTKKKRCVTSGAQCAHRVFFAWHGGCGIRLGEAEAPSDRSLGQLDDFILPDRDDAHTCNYWPCSALCHYAHQTLRPPISDKETWFVVYTVCQKMLCDFMIYDKVAFANKSSMHTRRKSRKTNIAVDSLRTSCMYMPMVIVTTGFANCPSHRVEGRAFPDFVFRVHRYSSHVFK